MKKIIKAVRLLTLAAMIPYRFRTLDENGSYEVGALLWSMKKTVGEDSQNYSVEFLPFLETNKLIPENAETTGNPPVA